MKHLLELTYEEVKHEIYPQGKFMNFSTVSKELMDKKQVHLQEVLTWQLNANEEKEHWTPKRRKRFREEYKKKHQ